MPFTDSVDGFSAGARMSPARGPEAVDLLHLIDGEMEAVVLGTILNSGEPAYREVSFLLPDDFAIEKHRLIWGAISHLAGEVHPTIDAVAERLSQVGKLEAAGGLTSLVDVDQRGIPGLRLAGFARGLRKKAIDRRACRLNAKLSGLIDRGLSLNSEEAIEVLNEIPALSHEQSSERPAITGIEDLPPVGESTEMIVYLRDPELPRGSIIGVTGDSGSGKSIVATAWIRDVVAYQPFARTFICATAANMRRPEIAGGRFFPNRAPIKRAGRSPVQA
jgi:replicative DNA helicase